MREEGAKSRQIESERVKNCGDKQINVEVKER
jgi:hypothetical protein